jgi:hypothetical protein
MLATNGRANVILEKLKSGNATFQSVFNGIESSSLALSHALVTTTSIRPECAMIQLCHKQDPLVSPLMFNSTENQIHINHIDAQKKISAEMAAELESKILASRIPVLVMITYASQLDIAHSHRAEGESESESESILLKFTKYFRTSKSDPVLSKRLNAQLDALSKELIELSPALQKKLREGELTIVNAVVVPYTHQLIISEANGVAHRQEQSEMNDNMQTYQGLRS